MCVCDRDFHLHILREQVEFKLRHYIEVAAHKQVCSLADDAIMFKKNKNNNTV